MESIPVGGKDLGPRRLAIYYPLGYALVVSAVSVSLSNRQARGCLWARLFCLCPHPPTLFLS